MGKSDSTSFSMKVLFLVLSGFAIFQAWAEEEASTSLGVVKDLLETLLTRVEHLENEARAGARSPGDDLEERLTKKIEDLGEKLHFEILNTARDVKDLLEDKMDDTKDELQEDITGVQDSLQKVNETQAELQEDITGVQDSLQKVNETQKTLQEDIAGNQDSIQKLDVAQGTFQDEIDEIKVMKSVHCGYQNYVGGINDNGLSGDTIVFDTIHTEINPAGSSLSASSGKFTAGKSGVYQVSVSASFAYTHDNTILDVYLKTSTGKYQDEDEMDRIFFGDSISHEIPLNSIRYIHLNQGETAYLQYSCDESHDKCHIYDLKFCISLYH